MRAIKFNDNQLEKKCSTQCSGYMCINSDPRKLKGKDDSENLSTDGQIMHGDFMTELFTKATV
jgi:hypothetical protein